MSKLLLVIINGPPGSGKTTLAEKLSKKYNLPLIYKDGIKEAMFDSIKGDSDNYSEKLGAASYEIIRHVSEQLLKNRISHILEAPINPDIENRNFERLKKKYDFFPIQIILETDRDEIFKRIKNRVNNNERHPKHTDSKISKEKVDSFRDYFQKALDIEGITHKINTTDFKKVNLKKIYKDINNILLSHS